MSQRYIGGLIYNPPGGFSGYFDGTGDYLTTPSNAAFSPGTGDFTIECWASLAATTGEGTLFYVSATNGINLFLSISGNWGIARAGVAVDNNFGTPPSFNTWNHLAVSRSGSTIRAFVNGIQVFSGTNTSNYAQGAALIGSSNGFGTVTGYISNFRFVKGTALYTSAFTPPVGPLQAITNTSLLTCAYPTFRDGSSNNFTITVNGNSAVSTQNPFPLTALPNPNLGNQGNGVYTMSQYQSLRSQNLWPAIDPYWEYVTLMLHGNGTNGAQNNTFLDSSTNNFTITRNGNTTQGAFSPYGDNWSNYFDGNGDYLSLASNAAFAMGTGDFTVEAFVYLTTTQNFGVVFLSSTTGSGDSLHVQISSANKVRVTNATTEFLLGTNAIPLNTWSHIAVVRSGTTLSIYQDGVLNGSTTNSTNFIQSGALVGYEPFGGNFYFTGYMSNVRVLKGTALYSGSTYTVPTGPLTAITNTSLLTCQSNRFVGYRANVFSTAVAINTLKVYSVWNGGTRAANYTVQYSDDAISWTDAFSGTITTSACGLITATGGGGSYGSHLYWRYIVGSTVTSHHPRVSRIVLSTGSTDYDLWVFTSDNCADTGTIPGVGAVYSSNIVPDITRSGDVSVQRFSPFHPTAPYAAGTIGGSGYFDGTGDFLTTPSNAALNFGTGNFTIELWAYPTSLPTTFSCLFITSDNTTNGNGIGIFARSTGEIQVFDFVTSSVIFDTSGFNFRINEWNHIAVTRSGTTVTLYKNGVSFATATNSSNYNSSTNTQIANSSAASQTFYGYISGLRVLKGTAQAPTITAPPTAITNTSLLLNFTNGGIIDNAMMNDLETVGNAQISTSVSRFGGGSMYFDGTGDWLKAGIGRIADFGTGDFTIEAWVYLIAYNASQSTIFSGGQDFSVTNQTNMNVNTDGTVNLSGSQGTSNTVSLNTWTHIAISRSSGTSRIFINGVQGSSASNTTNYNGVGCFVGVRVGSGITYGDVNGYIDDLRITKGYARYTANFTPQRSQWQDQ